MIAHFYTDLFYDEHPDGVTISLTRTLHYYSEILQAITGDGHIYAEVGFTCDMTSLKFFGLVSRGPWNRAAVVHDLLYKNPYYTDSKGIRRRLTKRQCDLIFWEAMRVLHTHPFRRELYYSGVLLFGHKAWLGHRYRDWRNAKKSRTPKLSTQNHP